VAKKIAICSCAPRAIGRIAGTSTVIKNPCGFLGSVGFSAKARSWR
jgi:hypothetical protein